MSKFGIDSNYVYDKDDKSVFTRLSEHDSTLNNHSEQLSSHDSLIAQKANQSDVNALTTDVSTKMKKGDSFYNVKDYGATGIGANTDTAAIQSVLNIAKTNGSVNMIIPDGTYWITGRLIIYKNTKITLGKKAIMIRKWGAGFFMNGESTDSFTGYTGNGNIEIDGGVWEGNLTEFNQTFDAFGLARGENLTFRNMVVRNVRGAHAFDINACKDVLIEGCSFEGYDADWNDGDNASFFREAIQISNHTALGYSGFGAWDGAPCINITVQNCYFGPSDTQPSYPAGVGNHGGVHDQYNRNIIIKGNIFDGNVYSGVRSFQFRDLIISDNIFLSCERGVTLSNTDGNTESSKDGAGVQTGLPQSSINVIIHSNIFRDTNKENVYCVGQEEGGVVAKVESVIITDNIFENQSTTVGNSNIWLSFVNNVIVKGNISRGSYRCLYLTYGSNVDITDNHIMDALYEGIWITEPDAGYQNLGYTKTIRINNNRIENTGRTAVLFQYCDGFSISGNTIRNSSYETDGTRDAINLSSGAKNGQVFNNRIRYGTGFKNNYGIQATASCTSIQTFNNDVEGKNGRLLNASVSGFEGYYIHSADGTRYKVTIANGGTISITAG